MQFWVLGKLLWQIFEKVAHRIMKTIRDNNYTKLSALSNEIIKPHGLVILKKFLYAPNLAAAIEHLLRFIYART